MQLLINENKYKETLRNVLTEELLMKSESNKDTKKDYEIEQEDEDKENFDLDCKKFDLDCNNI